MDAQFISKIDIQFIIEKLVQKFALQPEFIKLLLKIVTENRKFTKGIN